MTEPGTTTTSSSVLATLRRVVPPRPLSGPEAARVAELQANRLIELSELAAPPIPIELITELPRIEAVQVPDLPVAGAACWVGGRWLLSVAASERPQRQRFSLAHEFKHVLDHPLCRRLYIDRPGSSAEQQAERAADYFAACLLMPKRFMLRAWGRRLQHPGDLSQHFEVSVAAMRIRLWQLGLVESSPRCSGRQSLSLPTHHLVGASP